jgi:type VI secretion system protein ImpB
MADNPKAAPKERVNIRYRSAIDGQPQVELPLRLAVLGDFTNRQETDALASDQRKVVEINKNNFNDVLAAYNVNVKMTVNDKLSGEDGGQLSVSVPISHINDFKPEAIARNVPELNRILELREALRGTKAAFAKSDFKKKLKEILNDEDKVNKLMDQLGTAETGEEPAQPSE